MKSFYLNKEGTQNSRVSPESFKPHKNQFFTDFWTSIFFIFSHYFLQLFRCYFTKEEAKTQTLPITKSFYSISSFHCILSF